MRVEVRRIGVVAHQRPGVAGSGRCDQDRAAAAGVAQPAPEEAAAIAAAAVQRHHQRPCAVGRVIFRHVEREAAAAAGLVLIVEDAGVFVGRRRQPRREIGVSLQRGIDEELVHRRQPCRQRIEGFLRAWGIAQRAKQADEIALAALHDAQGLECSEHCIACRFQRRLDVSEIRRPLLKPRPNGAQGRVRLACRVHHAVEIRRVQVARDEAERFERLQQRRQHGHDVVHHGLTHRMYSAFNGGLLNAISAPSTAWRDRSNSAPRRR